jgi:hypothetical protein
MLFILEERDIILALPLVAMLPSPIARAIMIL